MFRLNAVSDFRVRIPSGTEKVCYVRFPTDAEWAERIRKLKVVRTSLGRDKVISDMPGQVQVDADLFERIRKDKDGAVFDPYEAAAVIDTLDRCLVMEAKREGEHYIIKLDVPGGETIHKLSAPTKRDVFEYGRSAVSIIGIKRGQEITSSIEPAGLLYDKLIVSADGYAAAVPITHKYSVVRELLDQVEAITAEPEIDFPEG